MSDIRCKYMCIRATDCGLCVCPENAGEGARVVLGSDHDKLWYFEPSSSTLRSADNDMCFTVSDDGEVTLTAYDPDKNHDQAIDFREGEGKIGAKKLGGKALACTDKAEGACVCLKDCGDDWVFSHVPAETKLFYLVSGNGLVLGTEGESREPGTRLVLVPKKEGGRPYEQLWYEAEDYSLRCAHNHLVLDCSKGDVTLEHPEGRSEQSWRYYSPFIYRDSTRHHLAAADLSEGSPVRCADKEDSDYQRWYKEDCV